MLGERIDFTEEIHSSTRRDYVARVVEHDKAACATVARQWGYDYWDGDRRYGYGGYKYDRRWRPIANKIAAHYGLRSGDRVLDIGCGKAFLLYEFTQAVPGIVVTGLDASAYAIEHAKQEIRPHLTLGSGALLPYADDSFDCVISLGALHNLGIGDLWQSLMEIERVGQRAHRYVMVESFRDEREKANLLYWQLTCRSFYSVEDWEWLYRKVGYSGDYGFIFFQ